MTTLELLANSLPCTLCGAEAVFDCEDRVRRYFRCPRCDLIFADPASWPSRDEERRHYDLHENDPSDAGYRRFLSRLFDPLQARLAPRSQGLDFGSGPGPTLSRMFAEAGHPMQIYDPFYAPDHSVLSQTYDFVTASEVVEHFHHPRRDWRRLWSLLPVGGWLGVMTSFVPPGESFQHWHYKTEPTHVSFYSRETFAWLAGDLNAELTIPCENVALLQRKTP